MLLGSIAVMRGLTIRKMNQLKFEQFVLALVLIDVKLLKKRFS